MSDTSSSVLVVEDDPAVREALERALGFEGYDVTTANDGGLALGELRNSDFDVIVLDIMMPHVDGIETCRRIRAAGNRTPILMLTAKAAVGDRVEGLDVGADDYMVKPFALDELLARLRALLRRSGGDITGLITYADITINPAARTVERAGREIELTKTEFDLLLMLARTPEVVLERGRIYEEIWGIDFVTSSNSLDVYIGYLRRKTEEHDEARLIHTVRGVGYVLRRD